MIAGNDLIVIKGMPNLEMQLKHRLMTKRGELAELGHPQYGCLLPELIGKTSVELWQKRAIIEFENTIREDPRVADLQNATMRVDNDAMYLECDVYPVRQTDPMRISIPMT
jgi:phage baseplate assembly protein W